MWLADHEAIVVDRRASQASANAGDECVEIDRFHNEIVGAGVEPSDAVAPRRAAAEQDHGGRVVLAAKFSDQRCAVEIRQSGIEDDEIEAIALQRAPSILRRGRCQDREPDTFEAPLQHRSQPIIVLDEQQLHPSSSLAEDAAMPAREARPRFLSIEINAAPHRDHKQGRSNPAKYESI
jgi:hypothetical protein